MNSYGSRAAYPNPRQYPPRPVRVPAEAGEGRLMLATTVDLLVVLGAAFGMVWGMFQYTSRDLVFFPMFLGLALTVSFVNHVGGTLLLRGSLGKLLFGMRVVRAKDGGRPGFWRTTGRWLVGFVLIVVMVMAEEGGGIGQAVGLRTIRRRDERQHTW